VGTGGTFLEVKQPGREADHSLPSSAEVKNAWRYASTSEYVFETWCLVKHSDIFTFTWRLVLPLDLSYTLLLCLLLFSLNVPYINFPPPRPLPSPRPSAAYLIVLLFYSESSASRSPCGDWGIRIVPP
jgi:hypothetical protein